MADLDTPPRPPPTLLAEVRRVLRLHPYSIHTERSSVAWIRRFARFHRLRARVDLFPAESTIEAFLTALAVQGHVAAATQHQAMHALVFLSKRVLPQALTGHINAVRADKKRNVPVVMTREAVAAVLPLLGGTPQLVAKLLYGSGWRIMAAVRLRVKDLAFHMQPLAVRAAKGDKDRCPTFSAPLPPLLQHHQARGKTLPQPALAQGHGAVYLPHALARQHPHAAPAGGWQSVFPARAPAVDPRAGVLRRHHVAPSVLHKAIKVAGRRAGLTKQISAPTFRPSFATHLRPRGTDIRTSQPLLGHTEVATTMRSTHVLQQGGQGVPRP